MANMTDQMANHRMRTGLDQRVNRAGISGKTNVFSRPTVRFLRTDHRQHADQIFPVCAPETRGRLCPGWNQTGLQQTLMTLSRQLIFASVGLMVFFTPLWGQTTGAESLRAFWEANAVDRTDIVMLGDSNQLYGADGWEQGWFEACAGRFGVYATGLISAGENHGYGVGLGSFCSVIAPGELSSFQYEGAPQPFSSFCDPTVSPMGYLYVQAGSAVPATENSGMTVDPLHPMGMSGPLRFWFDYGTFPESGGRFRPILRYHAEPYSVLVRADEISTHGPVGLRTAWIDLPPGDRTLPLGLRFSEPSDGPLQGPFFALWMRCERTDVAAGTSVHTLFARGGASARDAAEALLNAPMSTLTAYFQRMTSLQRGPRRALVRICFGINDVHEDMPSVGHAHEPQGNSPQAYADNIHAIIDQLTIAWRAAGLPQAGLFVLLTPSHPVTNLDEPALLAFRSECDAIAASTPNVACVRLDQLTSAAEMQSRGWYHLPEDPSHLSRSGYINLAAREVGSLLSVLPCAADFDLDGGVDGRDVEAFFTAFEQAEPAADVNQDGGVDGGDVEAFFRQWERGGC